MIREIGSEFPRMPYENGTGFSLPQNGSLVFSGRTAIACVLKTLPAAKRALLPAYCCDSMIQPFKDAGIKVDFYPVEYDNGLKISIDDLSGVDILFWCNYFGFKKEMPDFTGFKRRGGVIIEDITHSLLSKKKYHPQSDYLVASIRKWVPVNCGGYCSVRAECKTPPDDFIRLKTAAMQLKSEYLSDLDEDKKPRFLNMFARSNKWLADNYYDLAIDEYSAAFLSFADEEKQRQARINNAKALYAGLSGRVRFLFSEKDMDCPLFVPVLIKNRDEVRKKLTENKIYCPVHWPKPEGCGSNLYETELSLVCDQRYMQKDMERIVSVLKTVL